MKNTAPSPDGNPQNPYLLRRLVSDARLPNGRVEEKLVLVALGYLADCDGVVEKLDLREFERISGVGSGGRLLRHLLWLERHGWILWSDRSGEDVRVEILAERIDG